MKLGVVGLPNVGKSTLFNAITKAGAQAANYPFCTIEPNTGMVMVPDSRLDDLAAMYHPKKVTPTTIEFVDIAGLVKGASRGEGLGNKFLSHIREVDAIVHVVRCFEDENIIHVDGSIDPARDIETINLELIFADMETVSRRRDKAVKNMRGGDKKSAVEAALAEKLYAHLESGKPARTYPYDEEEREIVDSWFLLTTKPVIYAANIAEDDLGKDIDQIPGLDRVQAIAQAEHAEMLVISGTLTECVPEVALGWDTQELIDAGLNIFSVYEDTLAEFVRNVQEPFLTAMLPVLVELPASSYQSIFQLLEQYGVMDVLTAGLE